MPPSSVHFNGSVNLPDAETVMREISSRIPTGVRRMTDGETGERGYWILFQIQKFLQMPEFESVTVGQAYETSADAPEMPQLRLAEGASADTINWPNLGYANAYAHSFEIFDGLQKDGTIPTGVRFQMQYPHRWPRSRERLCRRTSPQLWPPMKRRCSPTSTRS